MYPGSRADRSARHPLAGKGRRASASRRQPGSADCPRARHRLAAKGGGAGTPRPAPLPATRVKPT